MPKINKSVNERAINMSPGTSGSGTHSLKHSAMLPEVTHLFCYVACQHTFIEHFKPVPFYPIREEKVLKTMSLTPRSLQSGEETRSTLSENYGGVYVMLITFIG